MTARLIYADSERCADMYYATGFFAPDPFVYVRDDDGTSHMLVSMLEVDRARRVAKVDHVHEMGQLIKGYRKENSDESPKEGDLIAWFLGQKNVSTVEVPSDFPLSMADVLRRKGISLKAVDGLFWPEREIKTDAEVGYIEEALRVTGLGMMAGIEMVRATRIGADDVLMLDGEPLTSERLRGEINATLVRLGAIPHHTIVSAGTQGADPHEEGYGVIKAHTSIIMDVFPRIERTGYFGDMTRTICRGEAPEIIKTVWQLVKEGQQLGFDQVADGVSGKAVHNAITDLFTERGFKTGVTDDGRQCGFFHGTGHGLGLEIHESPRISSRDQILRSGHVVTVEPGLYYPEWGGVRLEDVVLVGDGGCRNLTDVPKFLEV
ncbi:MAG: aminopeptidase P family protein [Magnetococcales bacterium]|nr:aminopeptidase P family protein [Magnetococcales bacterium]